MFEPLNLIERRMAEAASDPERRVAFGQRLLSEKLYVSPLGKPDAQGLMPGLRAVTLVSGTQAVAFFTAPERLVEAYGQGALILVKDGRTLFDWLAPGPFVLNPGAPLTATLTRDEVSALLRGEQPPIAARPSNLDISPPDEAPEGLVTLLRRGLEPLAVDEAWLVAAQREHRQDPSWLLVVGGKAPWPQVQAAIAGALQHYDFRERSLDVMPIDPASDPKTADAFRIGLPVIAPSPKG